MSHDLSKVPDANKKHPQVIATQSHSPIVGCPKAHSNSQFPASLHPVRGFGASNLGLFQKVEISFPSYLPYLATGWAVLEIEALTTRDFASLDNILNVVQGLIFLGVCQNVKLEFVCVVCLCVVCCVMFTELGACGAFIINCPARRSVSKSELARYTNRRAGTSLLYRLTGLQIWWLPSVNLGHTRRKP